MPESNRAIFTEIDTALRDIFQNLALSEGLVLSSRRIASRMPLSLSIILSSCLEVSAEDLASSSSDHMVFSRICSVRVNALTSLTSFLSIRYDTGKSIANVEVACSCHLKEHQFQAQAYDQARDPDRQLPTVCTWDLHRVGTRLSMHGTRPVCSHVDWKRLSTWLGWL